MASVSFATGWRATGRPVVRLAIPGGDDSLAAIVVDPRVDGRPHDPRSIAELQEVVALAAEAVEVGAEPGTASPLPP